MTDVPLYPGISSASQYGLPSGGTDNAGNLGNKHPAYQYMYLDWRQMRDTYAGQRAVKYRTFEYLPPTSGMREDGMEPYNNGWHNYHAYLKRALFHDFVREAVATAMGMLWNKPAKFEIPSEMSYLIEKASVSGGGLTHLLRQINREQLVAGRLGLLTDISSNTGTAVPKPYISLYDAEKIINWDSGFFGDSTVEVKNLVVLDESGPKRLDTLRWHNIRQYRVLVLGDPDLNESEGVYRFGVFTSDENVGQSFDKSKLIEGSSRGRTFDHIPFVFINSNSVEANPTQPPLLGLSDLCLAIYRLEADYRLALFLQTQDTLFTKGFNDDKDKPLRMGAGGRIHSPQKDGDAKYIGVSSVGLPELRTALENDIKRAASKAGEMMDASSRARESGSALEMRIGSKTATLNEIAINGAEGLTQSLRDIAQWMGLKNIEKIQVKPNEEFASTDYSAMDFQTLVQAKLLGGPVSWEAIHEWSAQRGGPGKYLTFDQLMAQIKAEVPFGDLLAPQITPLEQEQLDLQQQQADDQAKAAKAAANKPAPAPGVG
jgi:hypothetical protein